MLIFGRTNLVRLGIKTLILDERETSTSCGRADGLQPKSIETLKQMKLADALLQKGVKIYDIAFWESSQDKTLHRTSRQIHYPSTLVDAADPYILLVHQGMVEDIFLDDMKARGLQIRRNCVFTGFQCEKTLLDIDYKVHGNQKQSVQSRYLVGCDGSNSKVRSTMPDVVLEGERGHASWAVLDGVIQTNFPDLWSKVIINSETAGTILCIPRERNMTRLYIELNSGSDTRVGKHTATQKWVMQKARDILAPFKLEWDSVEWFGNYHIGQRVANKFQSESVFIAGDAAHTHSPKAAQGMNTSMHDGFNLAWKLNLVVRGLAKQILLESYENERRKIALDLIEFDRAHVAAFKEGEAALAKNFDENIKFISGIGAEYNSNILNLIDVDSRGRLRPGSLLPPARVTRFIDANPVDIQLDIPLLGQFRLYFFAPDINEASMFLHELCRMISYPTSLLSRSAIRARSSYAAQPMNTSMADVFVQADRYTPFSPLVTLGVVTQTPRLDFEIADLSAILQDSRWTVYVDDLPESTAHSCTIKWFGKVRKDECLVLIVRPDGYTGSFARFSTSIESANPAATWIEKYYSGFLTS